MKQRFRYLSFLGIRIFGTLFILLFITHLSRTFVEIQHIRNEIKNSCSRSANQIEEAIQNEDIFEIKNFLWSLKEDGIAWIRFHPTDSTELEKLSLLIGGTNSHSYWNLSEKEPVINRGLTIGAIDFEIAPLELSLSLLKTNWIVYFVITISMFAIFLIMFREIWTTLQKVESELKEISSVCVADGPLKSAQIIKFSKNADGASPLLEIYRVHLQRVLETVSKIHTVREEVARLQAKADLSSEIAHDIRSPLSALNLTIDRLGQPGNEEYLNIAKAAVKRINAIASGLLKQRKDSKGENPSEHQPGFGIDIHSLLQSLLKEKQLQFSHRKNVVIYCDSTPVDPVRLLCPEDDLYRIIGNLINNAVDAIEDIGSIRLSYNIYPNRVLISVVDDGRGMDQTTLGNLGKNHFTSGKDGIESGYGIGLNYAYKSLRKAHSDLSFISKVGQGTIANVTLKRILST